MSVETLQNHPLKRTFVRASLTWAAGASLHEAVKQNTRREDQTPFFEKIFFRKYDWIGVRSIGSGMCKQTRPLDDFEGKEAPPSSTSAGSFPPVSFPTFLYFFWIVRLFDQGNFYHHLVFMPL